MKKLIIFVIISLFIINAASVEAANYASDGDQRVVDYINQLKKSLVSQKENKGTYLGVISSAKGKEIVASINKEGKEVITIATSKNAFCMMKRFSDENYYCFDSDGYSGIGNGCSKTNISCNNSLSGNSQYARAELVEKIKKLIEERSATLEEKLKKAIQDKDLEEVKTLIKLGANVNYVYGDYDTPMLYAINSNSDTQILKELINAGADINHSFVIPGSSYMFMFDGITYIAFAAYINNFPAVEELIKAGADVNKTENKLGITPLFASLAQLSEENNIRIFEALIKAGANVNSKLDFSGYLDSFNQDESEINLPSKIEYFDEASVFNFAAFTNNISAINELIKAGADVSHKTEAGFNSLTLSLLGYLLLLYYDDKGVQTSGNLDLVKKLIELKLDVNNKVTMENEYTFSPLILASMRNTDVVNELIKAGAKVNESGFFYGNEISSIPLFVATLNKDELIIKRLKEAGAVLSANDELLVKKARYESNMPKIKATMDQMRSAAEMYKIENHKDDYFGLNSDSDMSELLKEVNELTQENNQAIISENGSQWCYSVKFADSNWCVDSSGYSGDKSNCSISYVECE